MHEARAGDGAVAVFAGGGTGGHLYPALAVADALRAREPGVRVLFIGAQRGLEARILPERGEWHCLLPVHGVDRSNPLGSWRAVTGLLVALRQVRRLFLEHRPGVVVVTGGYAGAPAGIVAGLTGIPLVLQEQNSVPGFVTRHLTRWAVRVHVGFAAVLEHLGTPRSVARVSGNPVRPASTLDHAAARRALGIPEGARVVAAFGGSQGSLALNRFLSEAVRAIAMGTVRRTEGLHLFWVTGPKHLEGVRTVLGEAGTPDWVHVLPYVDDMPDALAAADLVVSRAGAMSTAEILNQGAPSILVPLPTAVADHQTHNARALERAGACVVLPERNASGGLLWTEIERLMSSPEALARMGSAARVLSRPDAARVIADDVATILAAGTGA